MKEGGREPISRTIVSTVLPAGKGIAKIRRKTYEGEGCKDMKEHEWMEDNSTRIMFPRLRIVSRKFD